MARKRKVKIKRKKKIRKKRISKRKVALVVVTITVGIVLFLAIDSDGDGLRNITELQCGASMFNSDTDGDGLNDGAEVNIYKTSPTASDTDRDQLGDYQEVNTYGTNPLVADTDADGLNDGREVGLGTNPLDTDTDDDGINDSADLHPTTHEWKLMDSDGDGWNDYKEAYETNTDRFKSDTDDDGINDPSDPHPRTHEWTLMDSDGDGWSDYKEYYEEGTDRFDSDTDDDGYSDPYDLHPLTHEWKLMDSDDDGWSDYKEYYETRTDRFNPDTDGDGAPDSGDPNPLSTARTIYREIKFDYPRDWWNKITWTWYDDLSYDLYVYRSGLDRVKDPHQWAQYTVDPVAKKIAKDVIDVGNRKGYDYYEKVNWTLALVQAVPYRSDYGTTGEWEFPRWPIESLVDGVGDCEDSSILFAAILKEAGYDVVLLLLPGHMAVGVWGAEGYPGSYYLQGGKRYYYCETTGVGWEMGDMPSSYQGVSATLIEV